MSDPQFRPNQFSEQQIRERVQSALTGSQVFTDNLNGDGYHFDLVVVWSGFEGMNRVRQHQTVLHLFNDDFATNVLHAMTLKTFTPAAWEAARASNDSGKVNIE